MLLSMWLDFGYWLLVLFLCESSVLAQVSIHLSVQLYWCNLCVATLLRLWDVSNAIMGSSKVRLLCLDISLRRSDFDLFSPWLWITRIKSSPSLVHKFKWERERVHWSEALGWRLLNRETWDNYLMMPWLSSTLLAIDFWIWLLSYLVIVYVMLLYGK